MVPIYSGLVGPRLAVQELLRQLLESVEECQSIVIMLHEKLSDDELEEIVELLKRENTTNSALNILRKDNIKERPIDSFDVLARIRGDEGRDWKQRENAIKVVSERGPDLPADSGVLVDALASAIDDDNGKIRTPSRFDSATRSSRPARRPDRRPRPRAQRARAGRTRRSRRRSTGRGRRRSCPRRRETQLRPRVRLRRR